MASATVPPTPSPLPSPGGRGRAGGTALLVSLLVTMVISLASMSVVVLADAIFDRVAGDGKVDRAQAIGESGLTFIAEQWRASPTFLDYEDGANGAPADGRATTAGENAAIGVPYELGGGSFTLVEIRDVALAVDIGGKMVRVRSVYAGFRFVWEALLGPYLVAPIGGVSTSEEQRWTSGARFAARGTGRGNLLGNSDVLVSGTGTTITGDVRASGSVSITPPAVVAGTIAENAPPFGFPDMETTVATAVEEVQRQPASYWRDPQAELSSLLAAREFIAASATSLGPGWSSAETPHVTHLFIRGGISSLPAGNYAFGRLWLDNAVLTIKAPAGGGSLVLADLYLKNNARLILDTSEGPFTVVAAANNAFMDSIGGSASLNVDGDRWNRPAGGTATAAADGRVKPLRGTTVGDDESHDDWQVADNAQLMVVTAQPTSKGLEAYLPDGNDIVLANGGSVRAGIDLSNLPLLQLPLTPLEYILGLEQNALGFIVWSGGEAISRLEINTGSRGGSTASSLTGLVYGSFRANFGTIASYTGAFVGQTVRTKGEFYYDARLRDVLIEPEPGTEHVVLKDRVEG